jgi:hypothetical protein
MGHLTASLDAFLLLQCWCGHIFYDALMTKLNENNVTYVMQTMTSMNHFAFSKLNK